MKVVMNDNEKKGVIICGAFVAVVVAFVLGLNIGHYSEAQKARMQRRSKTYRPTSTPQKNTRRPTAGTHWPRRP